MNQKIEIRSDIEVIDRLQSTFLTIALRNHVTASFHIDRIETGYLLDVATIRSKDKEALFNYFNSTVAKVDQDDKGIHVRINSKDVDTFLNQSPAPGTY